MTTTPNAWMVIDHDLSADPALAPYTLQLNGEHSLYQAIADDDWVLILNAAGNVTRVGRVLRLAPIWRLPRSTSTACCWSNQRFRLA